ncbi:MAG: JAB domain-containing protein [Candidatus Dadabacteria bacterium]|nr:MAG: JAB domain-containing protein [Candidatus Dadabacteria bacterium]
MRESNAFQPVRAWPDAERPRERLLASGPAALSDAELLAILLRTGTRGRTVLDIARSLIAEAGGLRALAALHPEEWSTQPGVGPGKAATVIAAFELGRRTWATRPPEAALSTPEAVWRHVAPRFLGEQRETLWILGLDAKNRPVADALVGAGTADRAPAHPREVFAPLLRSGALKGILCHNHPSGNPEPSQADLRLTRRMADAGELLGIPIVDHVIVGEGRYVSLHERGVV